MNGWVLITGASSGIGLELARQFAGEGADLVLVARRERKLVELAAELTANHEIRAEVEVADLARPGAAQDLHRRLTDAGTAIEVLVNNAGFGLRGDFDKLDRQRQMDMIQVNVMALTELCHLFLPAMRAADRGGVINVASTAGFQPGPNMAVYYATKAFVLSLSEALYEELRGTGVVVSCLAPGATATEFAGHADMEASLLFRMGAMNAAKVAHAATSGFRKGRALVIPGVVNKAAAASIRFTPRWLVRRMVKQLQQA